MSKPTSQGERRLAAIMFTDMVGYTAMAQKNEAQAVESLEEHRALLRPIFQKHNGHIIDTIGDGFFVEFASALDSVNCAVEIQTSLNELNDHREKDRKILLRIGIHLGDVIHKEGKVMGDAVNVASRIQPLASPSGICVTQQVFDNVRNKIDVSMVPVGTRELKNVELPVSIYSVTLPWQEIDTGNDQILSPLEIQEDKEPTESLVFNSGIHSLDEILGGGYPGGSMILVVGPPGVGKEALGYWFIRSGLKLNEYCLYVTHRPVSHVLRDMAAFGIENRQTPDWIASVGCPLRCDLNNPTNISLMIKQLVERNKGKRVRIVTDVLSPLLVLNPPDSMYRYWSQLTSELRRHDVVLIAMSEEGMHSPSMIASMEQLFDGVIEMKLFENGMKFTPLLRVKKMLGEIPKPEYFHFSLTNDDLEILGIVK